ncbi:hypothetical protein P9112_011071 [Eukaryota sp. TZLM1-RC]
MLLPFTAETITSVSPQQLEQSLPSEAVSLQHAKTIFDQLAALYSTAANKSHVSPIPTYTISSLTEENYHQVEKTLRSFFFPTSQARELINIPNSSALMYTPDHTLIAGILVSPKGYIEYIWVDSLYQGKGLATLLLEQMSRLHPVLSLHVDPANPALRLYHKFGFKPSKENGFQPWFYVKYLPLDTSKCRHAFYLEYFSS